MTVTLTLDEWRAILADISVDRPSCHPLVVRIQSIVSALEAGK